MISSAEQERPAEWLHALHDEDGYDRLLDDAGSLAAAAHRLARAICRTRSIPTQLPTVRELEAAARSLAAECDVAVPSKDVLLQACVLAGLDVIEPMERTPLPRRVTTFGVDADTAAYGY